jgi:hypothetical protein
MARDRICLSLNGLDRTLLRRIHRIRMAVQRATPRWDRDAVPGARREVRRDERRGQHDDACGGRRRRVARFHADQVTAKGRARTESERDAGDEAEADERQGNRATLSP